MSIHESAQIGFSREAEAYERGRPSYPPEAIGWLVRELGLGPGSKVADVGAGTGKLTRALLPSGAEVIAVEPVAQMRSVLQRELPGVRALEGTAEALGLPDDSLDAVVAGQAFHWFDPARAPRELWRALVRGGRLGLVWNRRDKHQPLQAALDELVAPHRGSVPAHASGSWREGLDRSGLFEPLAETTVPFEQPLGADGVVDRIGSISFIASLGQPERDELLARVRALAGEHPEPLRYIAEVYVFACR
jgi:SAM-dependent methyltransferase